MQGETLATQSNRGKKQPSDVYQTPDSLAPKIQHPGKTGRK